MTSGIRPSVDCIAKFEELKKKIYSFIILGFDDKFKEIKVKHAEPRGQNNSKWDELVKQLQTNLYPYAIVDIELSKDGKRNGILLIKWVEEKSNVKVRMLTSTSFQTLQTQLKIAHWMHAYSKEELNLADIIKKQFKSALELSQIQKLPNNNLKIPTKIPTIPPFKKITTQGVQK